MIPGMQVWHGSCKDYGQERDGSNDIAKRNETTHVAVFPWKGEWNEPAEWN